MRCTRACVACVTVRACSVRSISLRECVVCMRVYALAQCSVCCRFYNFSPCDVACVWCLFYQLVFQIGQDESFGEISFLVQGKGASAYVIADSDDGVDVTIIEGTRFCSVCLCIYVIYAYISVCISVCVRFCLFVCCTRVCVYVNNAACVCVSTLCMLMSLCVCQCCLSVYIVNS